MGTLSSLTRRVLLVVVAAVLAAWLGLAVIQARDTRQAQTLIGHAGQIRAPELDRARGLLATAGTLNPDRTVEILRGRLALVHGETAQARRILGRVVAAEPRNLQVWYLLASIGDTGAFAHISQLLRVPRS